MEMGKLRDRRVLGQLPQGSLLCCMRGSRAGSGH